MKYMRMMLIFVSLFTACLLWSGVSHSSATKTMVENKNYHAVQVQTTDSVNTEIFSEQHKSSQSHTKFRDLAKTKRGKNRVLFSQNFQIPDRTIVLVDGVETPQVSFIPVKFLSTAEIQAIPESLATIHNENLYTIALRV